VHISSDVDSINPETEIPSIGITAKGGLTFVQIKTFIRTIAKYN
jgi:arginase family enzyme